MACELFLQIQWAKIILVVEQTVTTEERCRKQILYSQPMSDEGGRALVIRWHQSVSSPSDLSARLVMIIYPVASRQYVLGWRPNRRSECR